MRPRTGTAGTVLPGLVAAAVLLTGCGSQVAGTAGPGSGMTDGPTGGPTSVAPAGGIPLAWQKTFTSTRVVTISSVRVDGARRAGFLRQLPEGDVREQMTAALDAAPAGTAIYAGALDTNCRPSMTPRLRLSSGSVVLDTPQKSTFDGECYVAYTSYALVAVDPSSVPAGSTPSDGAPTSATG